MAAEDRFKSADELMNEEVDTKGTGEGEPPPKISKKEKEFSTSFRRAGGPIQKDWRTGR